MLKYSTYHSIYNETPGAASACRSSVSDHMNPSVINTKALIKKARIVLKQQAVFKLMIVLLLIISGFTVVSQVFASSASSLQQEKRIVVEPGDTLWSIALKNKSSDMKTIVYVDAIKRHNNLNGSDIQAGDILSIPIYK
ncbi:LysM domain-containing protein [Paenibacillus sophorae]|uniref:LysM domain-containing protein n=1 Tax=Paenibacillus sophorae TaxID=1333845 RepID=A0A1H8G0F8_9BACL|nr:LysM peptidoglycan-binding domain-containing protein [Paenibacillus sophorae]QWU14039.1 LysM peptidoglycan-binding domain-containing protein [Paenibacillus sophorae]SEN37250.1 LysM domain-containing protein [Paenibacillus sophorae]